MTATVAPVADTWHLEENTGEWVDGTPTFLRAELWGPAAENATGGSLGPWGRRSWSGSFSSTTLIGSWSLAGGVSTTGSGFGVQLGTVRALGTFHRPVGGAGGSGE